MTKKKDKKTKIKREDIPLHKAVYPLRYGTMVSAVVWDEHAIIMGIVVKSTSTVERFLETVEMVHHKYVIRTLSGEEFDVSEEDIYIGEDGLFNFIINELKCHNNVEE